MSHNYTLISTFIHNLRDVHLLVSLPSWKSSITEIHRLTLVSTRLIARLLRPKCAFFLTSCVCGGGMLEYGQQAREIR